MTSGSAPTRWHYKCHAGTNNAREFKRIAGLSVENWMKKTRLSDLLHFEDFFFLHRAEIFDLLGLRLGELFKFFHRPLALVLADFLFLLKLLDCFLDIAADAAHGGAVIFEDFVEMFDDVLAALFGERRNRHADDFAVIRGVQAKIGG